MIISEEKTVLLCDSCKGEGYFMDKILDEKESRYSWKQNICQRCGGSGRLMKTVTLSTYENRVGTPR